MVVFTAVWSGEGTIMDAIVEGLAESYIEQMGFYRMDIEQCPNITHQLGVGRLPTAYIFRDGETLKFFAGMKSRRNVEELIKEALGNFPLPND